MARASSTRTTPRPTPAVIRNTALNLGVTPARTDEMEHGYGDVVGIARGAETVYGKTITNAERTGTVVGTWFGGAGWYIVNTPAGTDVIVAAKDVSSPTFTAARWSVEGDLVDQRDADSAGLVECYRGLTRFTDPTQDELDAFASRLAAVYSSNGHRVRVTIALVDGSMYGEHEENPAARWRYPIIITTAGGHLARCSFQTEGHRDRVTRKLLEHPEVADVIADDDQPAITVGY